MKSHHYGLMVGVALVGGLIVYFYMKSNPPAATPATAATPAK